MTYSTKTVGTKAIKETRRKTEDKVGDQISTERKDFAKRKEKKKKKKSKTLT